MISTEPKSHQLHVCFTGYLDKYAVIYELRVNADNSKLTEEYKH